jgi:hypothetical protein
VTSTDAAIGSCSAWEIRSAATNRGSAVSSARIAISVAQAGHSVGEHRDGLRAADRVDLVHAEQVADREDVRVWQPTELRLRRARHGDRADAGDLSRHHVHQHAGRERREPAGNVEPHPTHRHQPLLDDGAGRQFHVDRNAGRLGLRHRPAARDRFGERGANLGRETGLGLRQGVRRDAETARHHMVEALGVLGERGGPALGHGLDDRAHLRHRGVHVELRARQHAAVVRGAGSAQVDGSQHHPILFGRDPTPFSRAPRGHPSAQTLPKSAEATEISGARTSFGSVCAEVDG